MLTVSCPNCQKSYKVEQKILGRKVKCKSCEQSFVASTSNEDMFDQFDEEPVDASSKRPDRESRSATKVATKPTEPEDDFADFVSEGVGISNALSPSKASSESPEKTAKRKSVPKAKKTASHTEGSGMPGVLMPILVGTVGGLIGAAVWAGISYATQHEIGYIAWGIGGLVGICVRATADEIEESTAGIIAAIIAFSSIILGKLAVAMFIVKNLLQQGKIPAILADSYWSLVGIAFQASFGIIDVIFFFLAVGTAYRLGSSSESDS